MMYEQIEGRGLAAAEQGVVARAAVQAVLTRLARQQVIAVAAGQDVVAAAPPMATSLATPPVKMSTAGPPFKVVIQAPPRRLCGLEPNFPGAIQRCREGCSISGRAVWACRSRARASAPRPWREPGRR